MNDFTRFVPTSNPFPLPIPSALSRKISGLNCQEISRCFFFQNKKSTFLIHTYMCIYIYNTEIDTYIYIYLFIYIYIYILYIYIIYMCIYRLNLCALYVYMCICWLPWLTNLVFKPLIMPWWPSGMPLLWRPLAIAALLDHLGVEIRIVVIVVPRLKGIHTVLSTPYYALCLSLSLYKYIYIYIAYMYS